MAAVARFWQFGEQEFVFRVAFIGPHVFKTKDANDLDAFRYGLLVTAGQWSMCWSLCPYESVTPNACSWRSLQELEGWRYAQRRPSDPAAWVQSPRAEQPHG